MTNQEADKFLDLMARAKAVWCVPELLKLTEEASSPNQAYELVLKHTGKRKKAVAARWYAVLLRDYDPFLVRSTTRFLQYLPNGSQRLRKLLVTPE